jgi:hypothetical protein
MKPIAAPLLLLLAGFASTSARADHGRVNVDVGITFGSPRPTPVYVDSAPVVVMPAGHRHYSAPRGYWDTVTVKTWVPGRWIVGRDRWGRPHRFFEDGYYAYRTELVWVETGPSRRGGRHGYSGGHRGWNR